MKIGLPFRSVSGILTGNAQHVPPSEIERLVELFPERS
jgi:hypothetical protein